MSLGSWLQRRRDRRFRRQIAAAIADGLGHEPRMDCDCGWSTSGGGLEDVESRTAYHRATDPRRTGAQWIDRDGNERVGMRWVGKR